jgi:hypothetical protein
MQPIIHDSKLKFVPIDEIGLSCVVLEMAHF